MIQAACFTDRVENKHRYQIAACLSTGLEKRESTCTDFSLLFMRFSLHQVKHLFPVSGLISRKRLPCEYGRIGVNGDAFNPYPTGLKKKIKKFS